jgi:hypothetical protein
MRLAPDRLPNLITGLRAGVFAALVAWAIITWDKPDRILVPAIVGGIILVVSSFIKGQKSQR